MRTLGAPALAAGFCAPAAVSDTRHAATAIAGRRREITVFLDEFGRGVGQRKRRRRRWKYEQRHIARAMAQGQSGRAVHLLTMNLKRVELAWRRLWIRVLVRMMRTGGAAPDWSARPSRVLFLRHDRAGDMVLSTGVMRAIAR